MSTMCGKNQIEGELYMTLKTIQQMTNENIFFSSLETFVEQLLAEEFGTYVIRNWVDNKREWGGMENPGRIGTFQNVPSSEDQVL